MKACLFDHDGTLADSEIIFSRATRFGFRDVLNVELTEAEYLTHCVGFSVDDWQVFLLERSGGDEALREELWRSIDRHCHAGFESGVDLFPSALPTLDLLDGAAVPYALVTNSSRGHLATMHAKSDHIPGRENFLARFSSVVTPEDALKPKPAPEMYALAAERLKLDPRDCLAFEDSRTGARAALGAGCETYAVINGQNGDVEFPDGVIRMAIEELPELISSRLK